MVLGPKKPLHSPPPIIFITYWYIPCTVAMKSASCMYATDRLAVVL